MTDDKRYKLEWLELDDGPVLVLTEQPTFLETELGWWDWPEED